MTSYYIIWCNMITTYNYPFKEGGRTQIARHNLNVFEGGGPVKCWQAFRFLSASYLQDFILVGSLILYEISFIFLKNAGGVQHCPLHFWKKCKNMKNTCKKIVWRSANSCRIAENQKCKLEVCRSPIAWYFQYILYTLFLHFVYHFHM